MRNVGNNGDNPSFASKRSNEDLKNINETRGTLKDGDSSSRSPRRAMPMSLEALTAHFFNRS